MAINVSFNGATIYKPGAYSKVDIDLGGGFPLSPTGIVAIFGEADAGTPGANEVDIKNNVFSPEQIPQIRAKYRSGPIVDAAAFLFAPATDGAIPSGAQAVYIYKTNNSTQASLALANTYGTLKAREYGTGGNLVTYKNVLVAETPAQHVGTVTVAPSAVDFGLGTILNIAINGAAPVSYTVAASANRAALISNLNAAFPGLIFSANGSDKIVITQATGSNLHRNGWGRSFEVLAGTGVAAFGFVVGRKDPTAEPSATVTIAQTRDQIEEEETLGGNVVLELGFNSSDNGASSAEVDVNANTIVLTVAGGADAGVITLDKTSYPTLNDLVNGINAMNTGWSASVTSTLYGQLLTDKLDRAQNVGALSEAGLKPARLKKDASEVTEMLENSSIASIVNQTLVGLPDAAATVLGGGLAFTGGTKGSTSTADIVNALDSFTKFRVNSVVPLFSRDASADIADNLTDSASNYTILGIHQAVKTHLSLMATTKKKSERQGYMSIKDTYANCKVQAGLLADFREQLVIQDVRQVDSRGVVKWFQPWALACLLAGARGGSPIGTPMTFKFLNCSGIRQTAQSMSTPEEDIVIDFDPDTMFEDAIQAGITFLEAPQTGGFRVVVDNTTYGRDGNWVFNRGNVLYAADVLAYDFRTQLENIYVGVKNTVKATEVKSVCESILATFLAQGITVSTTDAPNGYKNLVVTIDGNTINVSVIVKLVEGIDFVLADITLQRAQSVA
jgi:hypothetical protein